MQKEAPRPGFSWSEGDVSPLVDTVAFTPAEVSARDFFLAQPFLIRALQLRRCSSRCVKFRLTTSPRVNYVAPGKPNGEASSSMQTVPIELDRHKARSLYREYRKHVHWSRPIDRE